MELTLVYRGDLPSNGDKSSKQRIRREFHKQLAIAWTQPPLSIFRKYLDEVPSQGDFTSIRAVGPFRVAPLVTQELALVAELGITMLRPEAPGAIVTQGGDIDNRLKTLFDALRMPHTVDELPKGDAPAAGETPFFCLLEDDNLISKLSVRTDRLLVEPTSRSEVVLLLHVKTRSLQMMWGNMGLS